MKIRVLMRCPVLSCGYTWPRNVEKVAGSRAGEIFQRKCGACKASSAAMRHTKLAMKASDRAHALRAAQWRASMRRSGT